MPLYRGINCTYFGDAEHAADHHGIKGVQSPDGTCPWCGKEIKVTTFEEMLADHPELDRYAEYLGSIKNKPCSRDSHPNQYARFVRDNP